MALKAAVIGCGGAAAVGHLPWYAEHPQVELVGLVDSDLARAQESAHKWGGRAYADLDQMLDQERPDLASVCTPVHLHAEHTLACLNHDCHVLCEKPMAPTLEECDQMLACAQDNQLLLGMAMMRRFDPGLEQARQFLHADIKSQPGSGKIGRTLFARSHWICRAHWSDFRYEASTGGGVFQDIGSHLVDQVRWLLGAEVTSVQGTISLNDPDGVGVEVEDEAVALLTLDRGASALIETSWVACAGFEGDTHLEEHWFYGSKGALRVTFSASPERAPYETPARLELWQEPVPWRGEWSSLPSAPVDPVAKEHYCYTRMIKAFVSAVQHKEEFSPNGEDGRKAMETILGLYQSWRTGRKVALPLTERPQLPELFAELRRRGLSR